MMKKRMKPPQVKPTILGTPLGTVKNRQPSEANSRRTPTSIPLSYLTEKGKRPSARSENACESNG